jgi:methylphosphotriester-DNA--protein-cysteine methyltransferase
MLCCSHATLASLLSLNADQQRICAVLLDALRQAPLDRLRLPNRSDRRLLRITAQLLAPLPMAAACRSGQSGPDGPPRSLSRQLREETGFSFAGCRQQARLAGTLRQLNDGASAADARHHLGYSIPRAFVTALRGHCGHPPARDPAAAGGAGTTRSLASPAASG